MLYFEQQRLTFWQRKNRLIKWSSRILPLRIPVSMGLNFWSSFALSIYVQYLFYHMWILVIFTEISLHFSHFVFFFLCISTWMYTFLLPHWLPSPTPAKFSNPHWNLELGTRSVNGLLKSANTQLTSTQPLSSNWKEALLPCSPRYTEKEPWNFRLLLDSEAWGQTWSAASSWLS